MRKVRDTPAGRKISAWVVLNGLKEVGRVHAHFADSIVSVDVWDFSRDDAADAGFQQARAGGGGYDKLTAALAGLTVDGVTLANHAVPASRFYPELGAGPWTTAEADAARETYPDVGFHNYHRIDPAAADSPGAYASAFVEPGLRRLECLGYKVIQAI